ncbi:MAG TPA: DUF4142 domain-containing protein [Chitinophagaceae bacterium]|nr:DUF4142 domain-containing protein [Chitinophagaceae bacterium]
MKKIFIPLVLIVTCAACNNSGKSTVETADSINEAKLDTGLTRNDVVIDEASSSFIVRVANNGMTETQLASMAEQKAVYADVKSFAAMLYHDHSGLNQTVKDMAVTKNITLPAAITADKQREIDQLNAKTGKDLDREFISMMITNHKASIESFEKALTEVKDTDIRSLADKTLPTLRAHLDSAQQIQKRHW